MLQFELQQTEMESFKLKKYVPKAEMKSFIASSPRIGKKVNHFRVRKVSCLKPTIYLFLSAGSTNKINNTKSNLLTHH